jgi:ABC-type cobalamin/Fe3+-siderophores transport system ATPase subunit
MAFDRFTDRVMSHWQWIMTRWWPEDSEKLSKAMKEMGWYSFEKRSLLNDFQA